MVYELFLILVMRRFFVRVVDGLGVVYDSAGVSHFVIVNQRTLQPHGLLVRPFSLQGVPYEARWSVQECLFNSSPGNVAVVFLNLLNLSCRFNWNQFVLCQVG